MYAIQIAASVPTLRPLYFYLLGKSLHTTTSHRHRSRSTSAYTSRSPGTYKLSVLRSNNNPSDMEKCAPRSVSKPVISADSCSEENILPHNIRKTTEVNVSYEESLSQSRSRNRDRNGSCESAVIPDRDGFIRMPEEGV